MDRSLLEKIAADIEMMDKEEGSESYLPSALPIINVKRSLYILPYLV